MICRYSYVKNSKYYWNKEYKNSDLYPLQGKCYCSNLCSGKGDGMGNSDCKKVTISAFQSGSIIITGANSIEQILDCYNFISGVLKNHDKELKKNNILNIDSSTLKRKKKEHIVYIKNCNIITTF